ncbi:MAG: hypothetical protein M3Y85_09010, partial [Bacteroidota bacterium]|nr:hypothetical protein [Bacteroidota bacterium]
MNQHLQSILNTIQQNENLSADEKNAIIKSLKDADKELEITSFKLDRTEKVKRTTAILLEETIEELEQKRKAVEAQNRELQIEGSLEKVRSTTMAMHHTSEIQTVITEVTAQLVTLGFKLDSANFNVNIDVKKNPEMHIWSSNPKQIQYAAKFHIPYFDHPMFNRSIEAINTGKQFIADTFTKEEKDSFYKYLFEHTDLKNVPGETQKFVLDTKGLARSVVILKNTALTVLNFDGNPYSEEQNEILKRIGQVFDQAYTRFLDLQKAEAQAREARIEAALEKVRSRSLTMHKSDELNEVILIVFEKLKELKVVTDGVALINLYTEGTKDVIQWIANPELLTTGSFKLPYFDHPIITIIWEAREAGKSFVTHTFDFEEKNSFWNYTFQHSDYQYLSDDLKKMLLESEGYGYLVAFQKYSSILICTYTKTSFSAEAIEVVQRFSKVFEQAYTRFLDLQKAEAQAREAQIEMALEKVRSRSMAMHNTSELQAVIHTVHQELLALNLSISGGSFIAINSEIDNELHCWGSGGTANTSDEIHVPLFEKPFYTTLVNGINNGPGFFTEEYTQKEKQEFFKFLFKYEPWSKLTSKEKNETLLSRGGYTRSCCVSTHTSIFIINHFGEKFSAADNDILKRFGKVFEQTYTRFLDLQKAEAQAREAQIEVSLERVRARTMAMHSSEDVSAATATMFTELEKLGIENLRCGITIIHKNKTQEVWSVSNTIDVSEDGTTQQKKIVLAASTFDMNAHPLWKLIYEKWIDKENFLHYYLAGKEKEDYFKILNTTKNYLPQAIQQFPDTNFEVYFFAEGGVWASSLQPHSEEDKQIMKRFTSVFSLTFRRYQDLQKAEAQAREAQIELGLERVRARAMAMQKSVELKELIGTVFIELTKLDLVLTRCLIMIFDPESNGSTWWMANSEDPDNPSGFYVKHHEHAPIAAYFKAWRERQLKWTYVLEGQVKKGWDVFLFNETELRSLPQFVIEGMKAPDRVYLNASFNNFGNLTLASLEPLSDEHFDILLRFAKVFDLTYTRFNDLQNAEAQARESQIQLALERVRARTMAMQKSEELGELSFELVKQVQALGVATWHCAFNIYDEDQNSSTEWGSNAGGTYPRYKTPREGIFLRYYEIGQTGETLHIEVIAEDRCADHYAYLCTLPGVGEELIKLRDSGISFPASQIDHVAYFKYGYLLFITYESVPEAHEIFRRFANVFEQTYTRFLDLQKAEAQAREAKIETALERVRSRTMAMQQTNELTDVATLLFQQVKELGIDAWTSGFNVWSDDNNSYTDYITSPGGGFVEPYTIDATLFPAFREVSDARKRGEDFFVSYLEGEMLKQTYLELAKFGDKQQYEKMLEGGFQFPQRQYNHFVFGSKVSLMFITYEPVPVAHNIFNRFGKVFEQTYTRFLDLQKAEAQAREAKIELALERVRARTMAMHKSDELPEISYLLFQQV